MGGRGGHVGSVNSYERKFRPQVPMENGAAMMACTHKNNTFYEY